MKTWKVLFIDHSGLIYKVTEWPTREAARSAVKRYEHDYGKKWTYWITQKNYCRFCGEMDETTGHMGCQYPQDH